MGRNWSRGSSPDAQRDEIRDAIDDLEERVALELWPEELAPDVDFGSVSAARAAVEAGLTADDFEGHTPEGEDGFLVGQVREIADEVDEG